MWIHLSGKFDSVIDFLYHDGKCQEEYNPLTTFFQSEAAQEKVKELLNEVLLQWRLVSLILSF